MKHNITDIIYKEAALAACKKAKVGCLIIDKTGRIISKGHNLGPCTGDICPALSICNSISCDTIHAEVVAIARLQEESEPEYIFVTKQPCEKCFKLIKNFNLKLIVI